MWKCSDDVGGGGGWGRRAVGSRRIEAGRGAVGVRAENQRGRRVEDLKMNQRNFLNELEGAPAIASGAELANNSMLNMDGSDDPFYRYQMNRLRIRAQGTGGNKRTVLENIRTVAKDIGRPIEYLSKFYSYKMRTSTSVDCQSLSLKGHHELRELQAATFKFIRDYVMCKSCGNPETIPVVEASKAGKKGGKKVRLDCKSCGNSSLFCHRETLSHNDKCYTQFVNFMSNNPIEASPAQLVEKQYAINHAAGRPRVQLAVDSTQSSTADSDECDESDTDDWAADMSEEAVAQRAAQNQVRPNCIKRACNLMRFTAGQRFALFFRGVGLGD